MKGASFFDLHADAAISCSHRYVHKGVRETNVNWPTLCGYRKTLIPVASQPD